MAKEKGLQKLTEITNLETVKQTKEFLLKYPELEKDVWNSISKRVSESYAEDLGKEDVLIEMLIATTKNEQTISDIRNTTYDTNHIIITSCIHNYVLESRKFPSMAAIQDETKLSRTTIYNHLNAGLKAKHNKLVQGRNEIMRSKALEKLYLIGVQDNNAAALKHFINLSGGSPNSSGSSINNYIQINNLKISKDEFNQLPTETILEIETIISKSTEKDE